MKKVQNITLNHPDLACVFADGRPFFDLGLLISMYQKTIVENMQRPDMSEIDQAYLSGQIDMLNAMKDGLTNLLLEAMEEESL